MSNEIVTKENTAIVETSQTEKSMGQILIEMARDESLDEGKLNALIKMKNDEEDRAAKRAFNAALVAFKANPPRIIKNMHVNFNTSKGVTDYKHATIDSVCRQLDEPLNNLGLSFRWNVKSDAAKTRVTAIISHIDGYSEESYMEATPDTSGGKNAIQGQGSSVTYLKRYTLLAALGLAEQGEDDDGIKAYMSKPLDAEMLNELQELIEESGSDAQALCNHFKVGSLAELSNQQYGAAKAMLNAKIRKGGKQ